MIKILKFITLSEGFEVLNDGQRALFVVMNAKFCMQASCYAFF